MKKTLVTVAVSATVLLSTLTGGVASAATAGTGTCDQARSFLAVMQTEYRQASDTFNTENATVVTLEQKRASAANRGEVERVGEFNVALGDAHGSADAADNSKVFFQAKVVRAKQERDTLCAR